MAQVIIGRNTRVEVEKTASADVTITSISKASPPVVTYSGTAELDNGDVIYFSDELEGMVELAGQIAVVANLNQGANTFEIDGGAREFDSTNFDDLVTTSGSPTFKIVTDFATLAKARSVNASSPTPNKLDSTVLLDKIDQSVFSGNPTADISFEGLSDMIAESTTLIEEAAEDNAAVCFRLTLSNGQKRYMRCYVTSPGENIPRGDLATSSFSAAQIRRRLAFAAA